MRQKHADKIQQHINESKMSNYSITRRIEFDAGHRVYGHESKCAHMHGHRYVVLITCCPSDGLDKLGRVIDFGVIKEIMKPWIDEKLDHGMLLWEKDPLVKSYPEDNKLTVMADNPTAENIAKLIYVTAQDMLPNDVVVTKVVVQETPNCSAEYSE